MKYIKSYKHFGLIRIDSSCVHNHKGIFKLEGI